MFRDLVLKNRSYRGFNEDRKITQEEILSILDDARVTASVANKQPLKYYISTDKAEVESILGCTKWGGALPELNLPKDGTHPTAFVIILQDLDIQPNRTADLIDTGIVAQTILLSAVEKGLGGLMILNFGAKPLTELLGLPDNLVPVLVIALGEPVETVKLVDISSDESTNYYRDDSGVHYVPKRKLTDIVVLKS